MTYIFLDIETVPIEIEHEDIKSYLMDKQISKERRSLDPNYSKIITIGIKPFKQDPIILSGDEKEILEQLWTFLKNQENPIIVTHNGYQFDIPFIILRSIINNVDIPIHINTNKWSMENSNHFDTLQFFSHYGTFINPSLDVLGKMHNLDFPSEERFTGREIEKLFKEGELEKIKTHCKQDIEILEKLFEKLCLNYLEKKRRSQQ
jgi:DNA polymerase elongation subunit (family B)